MAMALTGACSLTLRADITPQDEWAGGTFTIGPNGQSITFPSDADMAVSASLALANGNATNYEPDTHTFNGVALRDPDGNTVSIDTVYFVLLHNEHATVSASFSSTNFGSVGWAGLLQPGAYAMMHFPAGLAIGNTANIALTGISGTPSVRVLLIGIAT